MVLFNCAPFQNGNCSLRKEFACKGSDFFPLRAVPCGMINHFYHIGWPPLNVTIFITHVRNCVMGATRMMASGYNINPSCPNGISQKVWYSYVRMVHCINWGVTGYNFQKSMLITFLSLEDWLWINKQCKLGLHCLPMYPFWSFWSPKS